MNIWQDVLFIGKGIGFTLLLLIGSLSLGILLGTSLSILRYKGKFSLFIKAYISVIRGTPLILQLSFIYFALPLLVRCKFDILTAGCVTFGINSSAYMAEILRAGIESLPKGQFEAAKTLQIPVFHTWKAIILPQVIQSIFPAIINEVITLLKETALISTIGGMDIMRRSESIAAEHFTYFLPLFIAGAYYYALVLFIEYIGKRVEKKNAHLIYT